MLKSKWQWIDNQYGPMGWFTDEERCACERSFAGAFANGHWRAITAEELAGMNAAMVASAYEQS